MSVINTNTISLNAQRNLSTTSSSLATTIQRLSSGLRINSARDDAAGLAISERFTTQIRGLNQAVRNANDGVSLAQTAEGALSSIGESLQRMRELAVQSANATNSASDRAALQLEVSQLVSEIDRVANQTQFNGLNLLDGTFSAQQFQVGANAGQTITVSSITSARAADLGRTFSASVTGGATTAALNAGDLTINGVAVQAAETASNGRGADSAFQIARAINASGTGATATANATTRTGSAITAFTALAAGDLTINGVAVGAVAAGGGAAAQATNVAAAINAVSAASGVSASITGAGNDQVVLTASDGRNIDVAIAGTDTATETGLSTLVTRSTVTLNSAGTGGINIAGAAVADAGFTAGLTPAAATGTAVSLLNIGTVAGANTALASIDAALSTVNTSRADLGAIQNRFSSVIQNLGTTAENLTASRSRIRDADYARETAELTRTQILQQAGTAMLAQANQIPQNVLSLLR